MGSRVDKRCWVVSLKVVYYWFKHYVIFQPSIIMFGQTFWFNANQFELLLSKNEVNVNDWDKIAIEVSVYDWKKNLISKKGCF